MWYRVKSALIGREEEGTLGPQIRTKAPALEGQGSPPPILTDPHLDSPAKAKGFPYLARIPFLGL